MNKHAIGKRCFAVNLRLSHPIQVENVFFGNVVVVYPTPFEGWGMAEDHGAPEAGQLPRVWTRGRRKTESRQRSSGAESVAGQCRMR